MQANHLETYTCTFFRGEPILLVFPLGWATKLEALNFLNN
jgi:hypothetical protein